MSPLDPALLAPPYKHFRVSRALADDYIELFINRHEYSIQATKPMMNGKIGWYLARHYKTKEPKQLDNATVRAHIDGDFTINLYSTNPDTQRCKWVAIDADYDGSMKDLLQLRYELKQDSILAALEQSRRGGHLWIFAETPLLASECRIYIYNLALRLGIPVQGGGLRKGIEVFPKQDVVEGMDFGNAMRGPLGVHRRIRRRYWFIEAEQTPERQMAYLMKLQKVTEDQLKTFTAGMTLPDAYQPPPPWSISRVRWIGRTASAASSGFSITFGHARRTAAITGRNVLPVRGPTRTNRRTTWRSRSPIRGFTNAGLAARRRTFAQRSVNLYPTGGSLKRRPHGRCRSDSFQPPYPKSCARQRSFRTAWVDPSRGDASCSEEAGHLLPVVPDARIPAPATAVCAAWDRVGRCRGGHGTLLRIPEQHG